MTFIEPKHPLYKSNKSTKCKVLVQVHVQVGLAGYPLGRGALWVQHEFLPKKKSMSKAQNAPSFHLESLHGACKLHVFLDVFKGKHIRCNSCPRSRVFYSSCNRPYQQKNDIWLYNTKSINPSNWSPKKHPPLFYNPVVREIGSFHQTAGIVWWPSMAWPRRGPAWSMRPTGSRLSWRFGPGNPRWRWGCRLALITTCHPCHTSPKR